MASTFSDRLEVEPGRLLAALEAAADALGLGVFAARVDVAAPRIVYVSAQAGRLLGATPAELVGAAPWEVIAGFDRERLRALIESRQGDLPPIFLEYVARRADGTQFPIEVGVARVRAGDGMLAVGTMRDVSARARAVEALQVSEKRFRTLIESGPDGVVISRKGIILFMNAEAARLLWLPSPEAGVGRPLGSLLPPDEAQRAGERIAQLVRTGVPPPATEYRVDRGTESRLVEIKSILVEYEGDTAVLAFARDATERRRLERELVRADRLAAVGTLAAAVAHEINNPLTYTHLSLQHLERELAKDPKLAPLLEHVKNARHGTERVATIVRDLRAFARVDDTPPGPLDVTAVVERAVKIAENELRHRARLVRSYQDVPAVDGNPSRLEQVFLNLLINAIQALPEGDPSRDTVTIEIRTGGDDEVVVAVADTGVGVPAAVRDRVFDPFFTTKPVGEGTGLGLAVCRSIVESLGGRIALESTEGAGTRVEVTLRQHSGRASRGTEPPPPALAAAPPRPVRVLVVDDEPLVRRVLSMALEPHHEVTCVEGGAEALAVLDSQQFDVILCDLMMPGMNGGDVYEEVARRHPGLERRIVFVTGGAFVPRVAEFLETVDNLKLLKPFDVQQVLNTVRAAAERGA